MKKTYIFSIFVMTIFSLSCTPAFATWSTPVLNGVTYQSLSSITYWANQISRPQKEIIKTITAQSQVIYVYRELQVWSDWTNCAAATSTTNFRPLQWSQSTEWQGQGDPTAKDYTACIGGFISTGGAAYYDYINTLNGYGKAEGKSAIGAQVLGQTLGNTQGDQQSQQVIAGIKLEETAGVPQFAKLTQVDVGVGGWPPSISITASFVPRTFQYNPDVQNKSFDNAIATWSGYYNRWTLNWIFAGYNTKCEAKGTTTIGGQQRPSTGFASISFNFAV